MDELQLANIDLALRRAQANAEPFDACASFARARRDSKFSFVEKLQWMEHLAERLNLRPEVGEAMNDERANGTQCCS